jgi:hypothetical protein
MYISMAAHEHRKHMCCVKRKRGTLVRSEGLTAVAEEWGYNGLPQKSLCLREMSVDDGGQHFQRAL